MQLLSSPRNTEPVTAEIDGTVVMMSLDRGKYFGMDAIGTRIWGMLAEPVSIAHIRDTLMSEYDVDSATCERDIVDLLEDMLAEKLVVLVDEARS